jgi:PIN domain nuclease of toxin-antitoxin system
MYLLDTQVALWLIDQQDRVPLSIREALSEPSRPLLVSAISALEVATKVRTGKLRLPGVVEGWHHRVGDIGATELPVTTEHALLAGSMPWHHRDPFDRTLVSQAIIEGATFVTVDRELVLLPAPRVLTW